MTPKSTLLCYTLIACYLLGSSWAAPADQLREQTQAGPTPVRLSRRHLHQISMDPLALNNCGGKACRVPPNTSGTACVVGTCSYSSSQCLNGYSTCGTGSPSSSGCPINLMTDSNNCGGCGNRCIINKGLAKCVDGHCQDTVDTCLPGFAACGTDKAAGCPVNLMTDYLNCGRCGNVCTSGSFGLAAYCENGVCKTMKP